MNTNVNRLQPHPAPQVQRVAKEGQDKEADFLALRLLNKKARVRLSADPLGTDALSSRVVLFAVANSISCFAAVTFRATGEYGLTISSLSELRSAFTAPSTEEELPFTPRRTLPLLGPVTAIAYAAGESRLLIAFTQGSIAVYDAQHLSTPGADAVSPLHVWQSPAGSVPRELTPNRGDMQDLVAVLYDAPAGSETQAVQLLDVQKLSVAGAWVNGGTPSTTPTSICWSTKGKQLAIGLQNGDIATFNPSDTSTPKSYIQAPPFPSPQSVVGLTWLSNPDFHCIYAPAGPLTPESEQTHVVVSSDNKAGTVTDTKLNTPYFPAPNARSAGSFTSVFRHWDPTKFLLLVGDSSSTDIGVLGCAVGSTGEEWANFSLEETSTPNLPLDKDMNDTVLLGLAIDLTENEKFNHTTVSGEVVSLPPPPIMYAYLSDGTITGWHIINTTGASYVGMLSAPSAMDTITISMDTAIDEEKSTTSAPAPAFASPPESHPAFGQPSGFGAATQSPAFGSAGFGQPSTFGQPSAPTAAAFAQPSPASSTTTPAFGGPAPVSGGFSAFSSAGASKFGQPTFGFGAALAPPTANSALSADGTALASPMAISTSNSEEPMSAEPTNADSGMGGLSLGGPPSASDSDKPKNSGIFGSFAAPAVDTTKPASGFGSSGFGSGGAGVLKPATGFGAFGSQGPSTFGFGASPAAKPVGAFGSFGSSTPTPTAETKAPALTTSTTSTTAASPAFGSSGFGSKPAFGQSAFGQSAFGQSAFGQPAFGAPAAPKSAFSSSTTSTGGGFAAFAKAGPTGFGSSQSEKPSSPATALSAAEPTTTVKTEPKDESMATESKPPTPAPITPTPATIPAVETKPPAAAEKPVSAFAAPNVPASPTTPKTPPTPAALKTESTMTTPTSSPFKASAPAPTTGAFAGLTQHPTGFSKLDSGFGAFGGPGISSSSPFLNPPKAQPASALGVGAPVFSLAGSTPTTPAKTTQPTFGSPSAFGTSSSSPRSVFGATSSLGSSSTSPFGKSAASSTTTKTAAPVSVFSAFASGGGFAAYAGAGGKSLSLKEAAEKEKGKEGEKGDAGKGKEKEKEKDGATLEKQPEGPVTPPRPGLSPAAPVYSKVGGPYQPRTPKQSYEEYIKEREEEEGSTRQPESTEDDDTVSFLSESFSEEEEELEGAGSADAEGADLEGAELIAPIEIVDEAEPAIELVESSPPTPLAPIPKDEEKSTEGVSTTTPPGSPKVEKEEEKDSPQVAAPVPVSPLTAAVPFGVVNRGKSTRPLRSSPLANAPISGDEDEDDLEEVPIPPLPPSDATKTPEAKAEQAPLFAAAPAKTTPAKTTTPEVKQPVSATRPKTPPLLSAWSTPMPKPAPFTLTPSTAASSSTAPATTTIPGSGPASTAPKPGGIFGPPLAGMSFGQPLTPPSPSPIVPPTASLFGSKPAPLAPAAGSLFPSAGPPAGGIRGLPPKPTTSLAPPPTPQGQVKAAVVYATGATPPQPFGGMFGAKLPAAPSPRPSGTMGPPQVPPQAPALARTPSQGQGTSPAPSPVPRPPSSVQSTEGMEDGMQKECINLMNMQQADLDNLKNFVQHAHRRRSENAPKRLAHSSADLGDPTKFTLGDSADFGKLLKDIEKDIAELRGAKKGFSKDVQDLESGMLRATMRKEEIVRFSKASTDSEFSKMLKARSLGPDHLETQSQLRRSIRVISDRVQKLEDHLQASKKRLAQIRSGKPAIRPSSLDTVNRALRNIDVAISQKEEDVQNLTSRATKIQLSTSRSPKRTVKAPLALSPTHSQEDMSSNVAVTTAAALNAERAAQKLKSALLSSRREPLLNTQAAEAPSAPSAFYTPVKKEAEWQPPPIEFFQPGASSFSWGAQPPSDSSGEKWTLPPFQLPNSPGSPSVSPTPAPSMSAALRRGGTAGRQHAKPVQLKKSTGEAPSASTAASAPTPAPSAFSWGPLPGVAPKTTIAADLTKKAPVKKEPVGPTSSTGSLSDSWVADGFGKK